jgi:hypothetical protein
MVCWRNWIAHLTTDQEVLGSSPRWIVFCYIFIFLNEMKDPRRTTCQVLLTLLIVSLTDTTRSSRPLESDVSLITSTITHNQYTAHCLIIAIIIIHLSLLSSSPPPCSIVLLEQAQQIRILVVHLDRGTLERRDRGRDRRARGLSLSLP